MISMCVCIFIQTRLHIYMCLLSFDFFSHWLTLHFYFLVKMDIITTHFPDEKKEEDEDEDDSPSLRDFPLRRESSSTSKIQDKRRSSSEPSEFFEFFNDFSSEMSNAEDIIFCGKLMPFQNPHHHQILKSLSADDATHLSRRCCDSLTQNRHVYRSMDCKKARRRHSPDIHRSFSKTSEGSKIWKPRWFVMMFGPLKLQPEMDLRDMKNRQVRRNPGSLFPGGKAPGSRRSFWGHDLLRVLSCKTHASVAVTTSISFMPHFWSRENAHVNIACYLNLKLIYYV